MLTWNFTKKSLSHILLHAFCPHFLRIHHNYFLTITVSFRKYKWKIVIYLFNEDPSKSTFFMLNMAFDVLWSTVFVKKIGILRFLLYKDYKNILLCVLFYKNLIVLHHADNNSLFWYLYQIHTFSHHLSDEEI